MASAVDNVTVKLGSQTSSSQFFVKDSTDNAVLTVNADNTTAVIGTLSVSGATTMSSTINVTGSSTLVGDVQLTGVISDNDSDITLNDGVIVVGDISDNNSDITLNDGVIIVGAISDNDSAVFVNDDLIIAGAISDNDSAVFLNDDVYITGTISDNSTNGSVTIQNLAGSRRADIRDNATDFTLGIDNSTVLLTSTGGAILPANATPGIMFTILVASAQNQLSLKTGSTSVLVTTTYLDNGTVTVGKSDNSTSLDNGTQTLCVAATLNFYQCFTHGGSGNDN
jgi:hypothetical protein